MFNRRLFYTLVKNALILAPALACTAYSSGIKKTSPASLASMLLKTVEKYHYAPRPLDTAFSKQVLRSFVRMLDPEGLLFTEESLAKLDPFKGSLGNHIKNQKTDFLDAAAAVYQKQLHSADSLLRCLKNKEMDFSARDTLRQFGTPVYCRQVDLFDKWEKRIKYHVLCIYSLEADSAMPAAPPSKAETKKMLTEVIADELGDLHLKSNQAHDIIDQTYLEAIANAFDPHTLYLSLTEKKELETALSKEAYVFGIRMHANTAGEIEITELMPGSPAWNSNKLNEGDVILRVKAGRKSMELRNVSAADVNKFFVSLQEVPADFTIRKKNNKVIRVHLEQEMLDVEENAIQRYLLKGAKTTIGYVYLPSFYTDFNWSTYFSKGCANDLAKELIKLKPVSFDGLIIDLRSNGGGSMKEAVRMAGIFIDNGAVGISHERGKNPEIIKDNARGTIYSGPLLVLVNGSSASASEFLAAVLQDYNRAIIVGSRTFGKATVQQVLPVNAGDFDSLSRYKGDPPGYLTLTVGCLYRVTGASHQKTGIVPDIELPELLNGGQQRESSYDGALEFKPIAKKTYCHPLDTLPMSKLKALSKTRLNAIQQEFAPTASGSEFEQAVPLAYQSFIREFGKTDTCDDATDEIKCPFTVALPGYDTAGKTSTKLEKSDNEEAMAGIRNDRSVFEAFNIINDCISIRSRKEGK
jgi:carboxyl-terminal processing protease